MDALKKTDLFPTTASFVVFVSYMALFICQGLLVTASKTKENKFNYNPTTVVLMTELLKLTVSALIYLKDHSVKKMFTEMSQNQRVLLKYFVPSFLYCVYNNLTFVNLSSYDPTTYFLLLQFRVVVTGIIFQMLFAKKLSQIQWVSLIMLTTGCIIKQVGYSRPSSKTTTTAATGSDESDLGQYINISLILIFVQVLSSCFAGVYNEYLLKEKKNTVNIMLQNVFMYIDSIVCNILWLLVYVPADAQGDSKSGLFSAFTLDSLSALFDLKVILIICNNAAIGIVTSFFLHSLNSILKAFASALELMFTAVLSWIIFDIPLDLWTIVAITIVSLATWLYSKNPVHNPAPTETAANSSSSIAPSSSHERERFITSNV